MPTLYDLLVAPTDTSTIRTPSFEDYFKTPDLLKGTSTRAVKPVSGDMNLLRAALPTTTFERDEPRNAAIDLLGQSLWSFTETAGFGLPSLLVSEEIEKEYLTPETALGKAGAAVGGTVGFVIGGPMKLGAKAVQLAAKPLIKAVGAKTVKASIKATQKAIKEASRGTELFSTKIARDVVNKQVGKTVAHLSMKSRWDRAGKGVVDNWGKTASDAIDSIVIEGQKLGKLTAKEGKLLAETFKKNIGTRPMQDFVDVLMKRNPNKFGFITGSMVQEGMMFGMIDAVFEGTASLNEGREYDFLAPLWGVGVGAGFGLLKLLPAAGKQSITKDDFKSGIRAAFKHNYFGKENMLVDKLLMNSKIIGNSRKNALEGSSLIEHTYKGKKYFIDLLNPVASIGEKHAKSIEVLRDALNSQRRFYGKEMMKESVKEDFKSSLANWKRIIGGTAIMNAKLILHAGQGAPLEPQDVMQSLLIGAFLNRRGRPLTPEMNKVRMREIRSNLNVLGEAQPRMYDIYPTLGRGQMEHINPLTSRTFKNLRQKAEDLEIVSDSYEVTEKSNAREQKSPELPVSDKSFPLFDEFYLWIKGTTTKNVKARALITEKEATEIEDLIREIDWEGKGKIRTQDDFIEVLEASRDNITNEVKYEVALTMQKVLNESVTTESNTEWISGNASDGSLGELPKTIMIDPKLRIRIERGEVKDNNVVLSIEKVTDILRHANNINETVANMGKGTISENPKLNTVFVKTAGQLESLIRNITVGESRVKEIMQSKQRGIDFDWDSLYLVQNQLLARNYIESMNTYSKVFSETDNPKWNEMLNELQELGVVVKDPDDLTSLMMYPYRKLKVDKTGIEGYKGDNEESLLRSVTGVLKLMNKGLRRVDTTVEEITIPLEKVKSFEAYLNKQGINTEKHFLEEFHGNVERKLFMDIISDPKVKLISSDIARLNDLASLDSPFATFSPPGEGGVMFSVHPIAVIGDAKNKGRSLQIAGRSWHELYNDYIGYDPSRPSIPIKGGLVDRSNGIVSFDRVIQINNTNDLQVLRSIVQRKGSQEGENAAQAVIDFVNVLDPRDNLKHSMASYIKRSNHPDHFLNFLLSKGLMTTEYNNKVIKYVFKGDALTGSEAQHKENRALVANWLKNFGIYSTDMEKLATAAEGDIDTIIDNKYRIRGTSSISQQEFFTRYFPDHTGWSSRINDPIEQLEFLTNTIKNRDGSIYHSAHDALIEKMTLSERINGQTVSISGKTVIRNKNGRYHDLYRRVSSDVQKIIVLREGSESIPVLTVQDGKSKVTMKNMQKGPFTNLFKDLEVPFVFVDGDMKAFMYIGRDIQSTNVNVLDMDSPHSISGFGKDADARAKNLKADFNKVLQNYVWEDGSSTGVKLIRLGSGKQVLGVPSNSHEKVRDLFIERIYDVYYEQGNQEVRGLLDNMRDGLRRDGAWGDIHVDAMRSIIIESMVQGKNDKRFLDIVHGSNKEFADLGKRLSLYHTPKFRRIDHSILNSMRNNARWSFDAADGRILDTYAAKNKAGFIVWNDMDMAKIEPSVRQKLEKKATTWNNMLGSREDPGGYDSISFISRDYRRFLELFYGVDREGSAVFKPIISSNGEEYMMFAKTVFVYDPGIQESIFNKHPDLDIMLTRSADKMKSAMSEVEWNRQGNPDRPVYIDKTVGEMENITTPEIAQYMKEIPLNTIGVSVIPEKQMRARQSLSLTNYMSSGEAGEYYNTFYKARLDKILGVDKIGSEGGVMGQLMKNALYRRIALLKMKSVDPGITLADMQSTPEGLEGVGHQMQWAALGGDPRAMGDSHIVNAIKSQFLDPLLSPPSETNHGEVYGGKAVIKQNFRFRDLDPTIRKGEKGENVEIYQGEIVLPHYAREGHVSFRDADLDLRAVDSNGNVKNLKKVFKSLFKEEEPRLTDKDLDEAYNDLLKTSNLGIMHETIKSLDPTWSIGILTTRYPRTSPNDLAILRLKSFLGEADGNTAIVNGFDVLNIFEGDYDVDEVDFMWAMNKGTWNHISRVKKHWVNTKDVSFYEGDVPEMRILDRGYSNQGWNTFDANNRVFKQGIGIVQKTPRLINHMANLGVLNKETGRQDLMKSGPNNEFIISVDYDNSSFFDRMALESQLIIDYWKGVNSKIVNKMPMWRMDALFETMANSVSREDVKDSLQGRRHKQLNNKGPNNSSIRIFRKHNVKTGKEEDLSAVEITILKTLMKEHSDFLTLSTEVYDNTGQGRPASYQDIITKSNRYFNDHLNDLGKQTFLSVIRKHGYSDEVRNLFGVKSVQRKKKVDEKMNSFYGDKKFEYQASFMEKVQDEKAQNKPFGEYNYLWYSRNPFVEGAETHATQTKTSGGKHGSIAERIYREILYRDPLAEDSNSGKNETILQGDLYIEMQAATNAILNENYSGLTRERMKEILPGLTKNVKDDINYIKYLKRAKGRLLKNYKMNENTRVKRVEGMDSIIKELEGKLYEILSTEYLETGDVKHLKYLKMVDVTREKDMKEATIQWYTLHALHERFRPSNREKFFDSIRKTQVLGAELYAENADMGYTSKHMGRTLTTAEQTRRRMNPLSDIQSIEAEIMERLNDGFETPGWGMAYLLEYAMPTRTDGATTIGIYNGEPIPISTKSSGRFKRTIRFMLDKYNNETNKQVKLEYKNFLEQLAQRYTAYSNFFDRNFEHIPLNDRNMMSVINNVPGYNRKLTGTWDRYESIHTEKGMFSKDAFGMGPEYDSHISFYRRLIADGQSKDTKLQFEKLHETLSRTQQLMMENNYMDPVSYFVMNENVATDLSNLGLDRVIQGGYTEPGRISPHSTSPDVQMLVGRGDGISIKPLALLGNYRLSMLKRLIKQGQDIKIKQKVPSDTIEDLQRKRRKAGHCTPLVEPTVNY
jgi:hypothetical protein